MTEKPSSENSPDKMLWQAVIRDVKPLPPENKVLLHKSMGLRAPARRFQPKSYDVDDLTYVEFEQAGRKHQKRRRDAHKVHIDAKIDLHGLTVDQAYNTSRAFIHKMASRHARWVLIVTGKSGVLFDEVPKWLELMTESVKSFHHARESQGGKGALCVALHNVSQNNHTVRKHPSPDKI